MQESVYADRMPEEVSGAQGALSPQDSSQRLATPVSTMMSSLRTSNKASAVLHDIPETEPLRLGAADDTAATLTGSLAASSTPVTDAHTRALSAASSAADVAAGDGAAAVAAPPAADAAGGWRGVPWLARWRRSSLDGTRPPNETPVQRPSPRAAPPREFTSSPDSSTTGPPSAPSSASLAEHTWPHAAPPGGDPLSHSLPLEPRHVFHFQLPEEAPASVAAVSTGPAAPPAEAAARPPLPPCPEIKPRATQPSALAAPGRFGARSAADAAVAAAALKALRRHPSSTTTSSDATISAGEVTLHLPTLLLTDTPVAMAICKAPSKNDPRGPTLDEVEPSLPLAPLSLPAGRRERVADGVGKGIVPCTAPTLGHKNGTTSAKYPARVGVDAICIGTLSSPGTPERSAWSGGVRADGARVAARAEL